MQKLDKKHARNIITEFYPSISKQVIIFPLLDTEIAENEYELLLPNIGQAFVIQNENDQSSFTEYDAAQLFQIFKKSNYVQTN